MNVPPDPDRIDAAAQELQEQVALLLGRLADEVLDRPKIGTPEWVQNWRERETPAGQARVAEWHLTKLAIARDANLGNPVGDMINARRAGADWTDIGRSSGLADDLNAITRLMKATNRVLQSSTAANIEDRSIGGTAVPRDR
jgi:hypothetical protein